MPHVSRYKLSKKAEDQLLHVFNIVLTDISKEPEMISFLSALLSETEKIMFAKRLALIVMIAEGATDTEIANGLHLTRITVAKMRYFYESRGSGFSVAIEKLKERRQFESFKNFLFTLARYSIKAAGGRL